MNQNSQIKSFSLHQKKKSKKILKNIKFDFDIKFFGLIIFDLKLKIERKAHNASVLCKAQRLCALQSTIVGLNQLDFITSRDH
jgi:hypothetical protein